MPESGKQEPNAPEEYKELKAGWKNEVEVHSVSQQEVAKHNTKKDLWITIHGKVYNVTEYARDHPGGADILQDVAGQDATSAYEDVGHSDDAGEIMQSYLTGVLEGYVEKDSKGDSAPLAKITVNRHDQDSKTASTSDNSRNLLLLVGGVAAGVAGLAYLLSASGKSAALLRGPHLSGGGSFLQGVLSASAVLGISSLAGAYYFQKNMTATKSFQSFPAHRPSVRPKSEFHPRGVLDASGYQKFRLRKREELSDGIYGFTFDLPTRDSVLGLPIGQHIAIKAQIDDHTVVRSYTPISNNRDLGRLELLIRVYPDGAIGNYLKNLPIGSYVDIRGPKGAMKYRRYFAKNIGMIAGGTGITPLYQVIRAVCEDPKDDTHLTLFSCNRTEADIMLRKKLDTFAKQHPDKLTVRYIVEHPDSSWKGATGYVTKDLIQKEMPAPGPDTRMFLCGPPRMVEAVKKNLVDLGHEAPGAVGKITDKIFCF